MTGPYSFTLHYVPQGADAPGPDIFQAIETQLGLKLEPVKVTLEMIVVDRATKVPTEN